MSGFYRLPDTVRAGGLLLPIRTDFRIWMQFELLLLAGEDSIALLYLIYPEFTQDAQGMIDAAVWFYQGGDDIASGSGSDDARQTDRCYDFAQDADVIFSSFWQVYGIDLSTDSLHWWNFQRLLWGLPEDSPFMRAIHYRTADTKGMGKEQKKHYEKLRKLYALKTIYAQHKETLEERNARMLAYVDKRYLEAAKNGKS